MDAIRSVCYIEFVMLSETDINGTAHKEMAKTILIADDSAQVRKYVAKLLRANEDFELCEEAVDGFDALAKAKECHPDLIILDLGMPVMNGLETARELKRVMPVVPIILFTLHGDVVSDEQASSSGIDLVIAKSDISKLSEHVRSLLQLN